MQWSRLSQSYFAALRLSTSLLASALLEPVHAFLLGLRLEISGVFWTHILYFCVVILTANSKTDA